MTDTKEENLEDKFTDLFNTSVSGTGEEELLRIASQFSLQLSAKQIKALLFLEDYATITESEKTKGRLKEFVKRWLELKQNNNSDLFVMRALDSISLRKFINEGSFKVDIKK